MNHKRIITSTFILIFLLSIVISQQESFAADQTYTVENTDDSGEGSLRWAINQANTHTDPADNVTIDFNLPLIDPNYDPVTEVWTITPTAILPILIGSNITIDGYTQPGASLPTEFRSPTLKVVIDGSALPNNILSIGLGIASSNNVVRGLVIQNFPSNGIALGLPSINVSNNIISGNCIGTDYECAHDEGNQGDGVYIGGGAKNNIIGGDSPEGRNYILFNQLDGIGIYGSNTSDNVVSGNIIISNRTQGIRIYGGSMRNTIGGMNPSERNLISGNTKDGIHIQGSGTNENAVVGNYIGTTSDGDLELSNRDNGIQITEGAQENTIGGGTAGSGNLISGNVESGVLISGTNTISNTVSGNLIGTFYDISEEIPNGNGVEICCGAQFNLIGGGTDDERNIISGNEQAGVDFADPGTSNNVVIGNYIGTNAYGTQALANGDDGIYIHRGASDNTIGGDTTGHGNLISGNNGIGVFLNGDDTAGNLISGNFIGTNITGTEVISNTSYGVLINGGAHDNLIGGTTTAERNLISGNGRHGILIEADAADNVVSGNHIGTDVSGTTSLGNQSSGISISNAQDNTIGGEEPGEGNLISGNSETGVRLSGDITTGNVLVGNLIGTDKDGVAALPNSSGVSIRSGASSNTIGGDSPAARNVISGNKYDGVYIYGEGTSNNTVSGNFIGTDTYGSTALGNDDDGVSISGGAQDNVIGGDTLEEGNIVSGNDGYGFTLSSENTMGNILQNNLIGVAVDGTSSMGNDAAGIIISDASQNTIGPSNIIAFSTWEGVWIRRETAVGNVITQNSIYLNKLIGINLDDGAHGDIPSPAITTATNTGDVSGTACPNCIVELFWSGQADGQGEVYLGSTTATSTGAFSLSVAFPGAYNLTATATDARGTSEFSEVYEPIYFAYLPITLEGD